jgi:serine protease Do
MGLSFAIPINTAIAVAKQLLAQGHATHGWLGASTQDLSQELAHAYGLEAPRGALLNEITPASPAERAGLQVGDIILALDDFPIVDSADLPPRIGASHPGDSRVLTVLRDGHVDKIKVQIAELGSGNPTNKRTGAVSKSPRLGLQLADLDDATRQVLGLHGGVEVAEVEAGAAGVAGVQPGDILLKIGRYPVENVSQLNEIVARLGSNLPVPILVKRQDNAMFIAITLAGSEPR